MCWPLLCGMARTKYYLMLGEAIDGAKAQEIGLLLNVSTIRTYTRAALKSLVASRGPL